LNLRSLVFIRNRLLVGIFVVMGIIALNFCLIRLAPGDPAMIMAGESGASDEQFIERIRAQYGLDQPLFTQMVTYFKNLMTLDFGYSYRQKRDNFDLIMERLPATLLLTGVAYIGALSLGSLIGFIAARSRAVADSVLNALSLVFHSMPIFWTGIMLILLFSLHLGWFPPFGMRSFIPPHGTWNRMLDVAHHLVLPATTLTLFYVAIYARVMRASLKEVQRQDYVETALAKGASQNRVWYRHILRNALIPVVTMAGIQGGQIIGGSVLIETVFAWPGLGRLAFDAVLQRDYNLLLGVFIVTSVCVVMFNIVTDVIYHIIDPRMGAE
jgi:peptide/nickel transport system permease protein